MKNPKTESHSRISRRLLRLSLCALLALRRTGGAQKARRSRRRTGRTLVAAVSAVAVRVQRLARELLAARPEELYLEQVVAVVVGCNQGEALADELALIDRQAREFRRGDA